MEQTIEATFDGEVFRLDEKIDLEPNTKVRITVEEPKKLKLVEMPEKRNRRTEFRFGIYEVIELGRSEGFFKKSR